MWQPSWSPHPPPGAHGAPLGQPAGNVAPPPQGVHPHTMVVAQPMNQQWMGNPTGRAVQEIHQPWDPLPSMDQDLKDKAL